MPSCCIDGCKSTWSKKIKRHLFTAKTVKIAELWRNVIPNAENMKDLVVCDLHFEKSDVITEDVVKLVDGTEFRSKRCRALLKEGAIPKFFPEPSVNNKNKMIEFRPPPFVEALLNEDFGKETNFTTIYKQAENIPLPSAYWSLKKVRNGIAITKWNTSYSSSSLTTRLLINVDKTVNVYAGEKLVNFPDGCQVDNVQDIVQLLKELDKVIPCMEGNQPRADNCIGFVLQKGKSAKGPQGKFCINCKMLWNRNRTKAKDTYYTKNLKLKNKKLKEDSKSIEQGKKWLTKKMDLDSELKYNQKPSLPSNFTDLVLKLEKTVGISRHLLENVKTVISDSE